ncbi:hypothetical protein QUF88_04295 [Bacillus sp. DX1.1]|uniref:hypothetical protein n=1 Tax=unclassified Bacillus (in: firmicutes) TaxID=185979 RepID=UPI00256FAF8C|nr:MULTISPECIES: hypothetical protein [unclassified Bacillus (in: firmicutes)]MDM5153112.1 hypothetical protein [Bacillus sp. DX1.1]WJE82085.1 hypothetical protein QRE67_01820 [Bacillus sp. DX3.1]
MRLIRKLKSLIQKTPVYISFILFFIAIANMSAPFLVNAINQKNDLTQELHSYLKEYEGTFIIEDSEFQITEKTKIEMDEFNVYLNYPRNEINKSNYVLFERDKTIFSYGNQVVEQQYKENSMSVSQFIADFQDITFQLNASNILITLLKVALKFFFVSLVLLIVIQMMTRKSIKFLQGFRYLSASAIISSFILVISRSLIFISDAHLELMSFLMVSIILCLFIADEFKKYITKDYMGEGLNERGIR